MRWQRVQSARARQLLCITWQRAQTTSRQCTSETIRWRTTERQVTRILTRNWQKPNMRSSILSTSRPVRIFPHSRYSIQAKRKRIDGNDKYICDSSERITDNILLRGSWSTLRYGSSDLNCTTLHQDAWNNTSEMSNCVTRRSIVCLGSISKIMCTIRPSRLNATGKHWGSLMISWSRIRTGCGRGLFIVTTRQSINYKSRLIWSTTSIYHLACDRMPRKSKAQKLRSILFIYWEQRLKKPGDDEFDFEVYYQRKMDQIINHFAKKIQ